MKASFIPLATSQAGLCLTMANWQELGIQTLAYSLSSLLMKPGYSLLKSLSNLQSYCGWSGSIVLNAGLAAANSEGVYTLRSVYDGSIITISQDELFSLISQLQPELAILPSDFSAYLIEKGLSLPPSIRGFTAVDEGRSDFAVHLIYENTVPFASFMSRVKQFSSKSIYVSGPLHYSQARELIDYGINYLETDKPATDALEGQVYSKEGDFSLLQKERVNQHQTIDANCGCPTCGQNLTRAYLHHLFSQTPLLCQRFLIQHNAHYYNHQLGLQT